MEKNHQLQQVKFCTFEQKYPQNKLMLAMIWTCDILGYYSLKRRRLTDIEIPIIDQRRSDDRLRSMMGIPVPMGR